MWHSSSRRWSECSRNRAQIHHWNRKSQSVWPQIGRSLRKQLNNGQRSMQSEEEEMYWKECEGNVISIIHVMSVSFACNIETLIHWNGVLSVRVQYTLNSINTSLHTLSMSEVPH